MNSTLQDIMGLLNQRMIKVPTDKDYMVIAGLATRGVLTPQPKLQPSVITLGSLKEHILSSTTLNSVLTAGNTSLLDAKIGELYLFDNADGEYGKIELLDSSFNIFESSGRSMFTVDGGNLTLNNGNATANISNSLTTPQSYTLPNQSGTFALTSDTTLQQVTTAGNTTTNTIAINKVDYTPAMIANNTAGLAISATSTDFIVGKFNLGAANNTNNIVEFLKNSVTQSYITHDGIAQSNRLLINTTSINASAQAQIDSTTKGFLPPRMTTVQKDAILTPTPGLVVYDTTLNKLCVRGASAWQTITSA